MAQAEQEPRFALLRTEANMKQRKRILNLMANSRARGANDRAQKYARRIGVNMIVENAWYDADTGTPGYVFGACPRKDNIFQCLPQPNLHGMDEGLTAKTNHGILEAAIVEAKALHNISATEVIHPDVTSTHDCDIIVARFISIC
jgi:hypothetical protein